MSSNNQQATLDNSMGGVQGGVQGNAPAPQMQPPPKTPVPDRIRAIMGLKAKSGLGSIETRASTKRRNAKIQKFVVDKVERAKAVLSGQKGELDYVRRHTRTSELLASHKDNPLMTDAFNAATQQIGQLPAVPVVPPRDGKAVDWAGPYVQLGLVAETLAKAANDAESRVSQAKTGKGTKALMAAIAVEQQRLLKREIPPAQHDHFAERLTALSFQVVLGTPAQDVVDRAVGILRDELTQVTLTSQQSKATLLDRHRELSRRLAASPGPEASRLELSGLLSQLEGSTLALDFDAANTHLDAAVKADAVLASLDQAIRKQQTKERQGKLDDAERGETAAQLRLNQATERLDEAERGGSAVEVSELEAAQQEFQAARKGMVEARRTVERLNPKTVEQTLESLRAMLDQTLRGRSPGVEIDQEDYSLALRLQADVENIPFMLEKGGDDVAVEIGRLLVTLTKSCEELLAQVGKTPRQGETRSGQDEREAKLLRAEFTPRLQKAAEAARELMSRSGGGEGYAGPWNGRVEGLTLRLEALLKPGAKAAERDFQLLRDELEVIEQGMAAEGKQDPKSPDQVAFEGEAAIFVTRIKALEGEVTALMEADSAVAVSLDLLGLPAQLRTGGEKLTSTPPAPEEMRAVAEKLKLVNASIAEKLELIERTPKSQPPTAETLQQQCEALRAGYALRIGAVTTLLTQDSDKWVSSLGADQLKALPKYGAVLSRKLLTSFAPAAPGASADKALLLETKGALTTFGAEVDKFEKMGPGPKHVSKMKHFSDVTKLVTELEKDLGDTLFGPRKDVTEAWTTALGKIKADPTKADPDLECSRLEQMRLAIAQAKTVAQKEHDDTLKMIAAIQRLWDLVTLPATPELKQQIATWNRAFADFSRDCDKAIQAMRSADREDSTQLESLHKRFEALTGTDNTARDTAESAALKQQDAHDVALAELNQLLEVDIRLMQEKAKAVPGAPGREMTKQLAMLVKSANTAVTTLTSGRDAGQAMAMAQSITSRLGLIEDSPLGNTTRGRNQLAFVEANWRRAVQAVQKRLSDVEPAIDRICKAALATTPDPTLETEVGDAMKALDTRLLAPVRALFQEEAFKATIARMETGGEDAKLDAREDGLAEVRRLRRLMLAQPEVRQLAKCPFVEAQVSFRPIELALNDIETNLNISDTV